MVLKGVRSAAILLILLAFLCAHASGVENKTAYTRDGVHFVSKERMEENILYQYARSSDYREVQVPLDTVVVGASVIPELGEEEEMPEAKGDEGEKGKESPNAEENAPEYPYAAIGVGVVLISGLVASVAWIWSKKGRRGRRKLRRR
ncbi:MAG: hypothetical protein ACP5OM_03670 [Methanothrix sp.]